MIAVCPFTIIVLSIINLEAFGGRGVLLRKFLKLEGYVTTIRNEIDIGNFTESECR